MPLARRSSIRPRQRAHHVQSNRRRDGDRRDVHRDDSRRPAHHHRRSHGAGRQLRTPELTVQRLVHSPMMEGPSGARRPAGRAGRRPISSGGGSGSSPRSASWRRAVLFAGSCIDPGSRPTPPTSGQHHQQPIGGHHPTARVGEGGLQTPRGCPHWHLCHDLGEFSGQPGERLIRPYRQFPAHFRNKGAGESVDLRNGFTETFVGIRRSMTSTIPAVRRCRTVP